MCWHSQFMWNPFIMTPSHLWSPLPSLWMETWSSSKSHTGIKLILACLSGASSVARVSLGKDSGGEEHLVPITLHLQTKANFTRSESTVYNPNTNNQGNNTSGSLLQNYLFIFFLIWINSRWSPLETRWFRLNHAQTKELNAFLGFLHWG